jgi:hypothetical protein
MFVAPTWDSGNSQYVIEVDTEYPVKQTRVYIKKDTNGSTVFNDLDILENVTDQVIHALIEEGNQGNWFTKLPSHDQLVKRVRHTFLRLSQDSENASSLHSILLTPKQLTLVWHPYAVSETVKPPQISFDSDSESDSGSAEIPESNLPPVKLTDDSKVTHEEYLLTRLRAAKARVEAEQIRMEFFEATGRMPPDSDLESEEE